ncbi:unnamed protein product [Moneuplotes crassus]|uniref:Uncharacterized protein n=1 Tax=Euplotes crassus TaxID=5936 RepID=A0AAD1XSZ1_EUPCR|nr:unnamed protein product [Moneuplotes crassus]
MEIQEPRIETVREEINDFLVTVEKKEGIPLYFTENIVSISSNIAKIEFVQYYFNPSSEPVEAMYFFPVHNDCTFTDFEARFGKEIIKATVEERRKAKIKYDDAVAQGKTAFMAQPATNSQDMIRIDMGNLPPKSQIIIICTFHQTMEVDDLSWKLHIPSKIMPRYMGDLTEYRKTGQHLKDMAQDMHQDTPEDRLEEIIEHITAYYNSSSFNWSITVSINSQSSIHRVVSPSHDIKVDFLDPTNKDAFVELAEPGLTTFFDRDFVLLYRNHEINKPMVLMQKRGLEYALMVSMLADISPDYKASKHRITSNTKVDLDPKVRYLKKLEEQMKPAEFIFLLDRSYSMTGRPMETAKSALILFLHSLPPNSRFNIISFGSTFEKLFSDTVSYNQARLSSAIIKIKQFSADLGGTEIYSPLKAIFSKRDQYPELEKHVFILTDGAVFSPQLCSDLIRESCNRAKNFAVHTIGVGDYVSTQLVIECAKAGSGKYYFVQNYTEDLEKTVVDSLCKCFEDKIVISQMGLATNGDKKYQFPEIEKVPSRLFNGDYFTYFCIINDVEDKLEGSLSIKLSMKLGTKKKKYLFNMQEDVKLIGGDSIFKMFCSSYIRDLDKSWANKEAIVSLATEYQIPSKHTALIGKPYLIKYPLTKNPSFLT